MHLVQKWATWQMFRSMSSIITYNLLPFSADMWSIVYSPQTGYQQQTKLMISKWIYYLHEQEGLAIEPWRLTYGQLHHSKKMSATPEIVNARVSGGRMELSSCLWPALSLLCEPLLLSTREG